MEFKGKLKLKHGTEFKTVEVWFAGRKGTLAPKSYYYRYNGRWIGRLERQIYRWHTLTLNELLKFTYSIELMSNLVMKENPLLALIPKDNNFGGAYIQIWPFGKV